MAKGKRPSEPTAAPVAPVKPVGPTKSVVDVQSQVKRVVKKITKADIVKSGITHGMVLLNPNSGDHEIHNISNARDLTSLSRWTVIKEFGSTRAVKMSDVLSEMKNIPTSNDED